MSFHFCSPTCASPHLQGCSIGTVAFTSLQRSQALISYGGGGGWVGSMVGRGGHCGEQESLISIPPSGQVLAACLRFEIAGKKSR